MKNQGNSKIEHIELFEKSSAEMLATFQFLEKCYKSNTKNKEKSGKQV